MIFTRTNQSVGHNSCLKDPTFDRKASAMKVLAHGNSEPAGWPAACPISGLIDRSRPIRWGPTNRTARLPMDPSRCLMRSALPSYTHHTHKTQAGLMSEVGPPVTVCRSIRALVRSVRLSSVRDGRVRHGRTEGSVVEGGPPTETRPVVVQAYRIGVRRSTCSDHGPIATVGGRSGRFPTPFTGRCTGTRGLATRGWTGGSAQPRGWHGVAPTLRRQLTS